MLGKFKVAELPEPGMLFSEFEMIKIKSRILEFQSDLPAVVRRVHMQILSLAFVLTQDEEARLRIFSDNFTENFDH